MSFDLGPEWYRKFWAGAALAAMGLILSWLDVQRVQETSQSWATFDNADWAERCEVVAFWLSCTSLALNAAVLGNMTVPAASTYSYLERLMMLVTTILPLAAFVVFVMSVSVWLALVVGVAVSLGELSFVTGSRRGSIRPLLKAWERYGIPEWMVPPVNPDERLKAKILAKHAKKQSRRGRPL